MIIYRSGQRIVYSPEHLNVSYEGVYIEDCCDVAVKAVFDRPLWGGKLGQIEHVARRDIKPLESINDNL